jgi:hypothetical protein
MIEHCRHGEISQCRVIEILSDHSRCLAEDHFATPAGSAEADASHRGAPRRRKSAPGGNLRKADQ